MAGRKPGSESLDVEVYGSRYTLRGGDDPSAVRALAAELDARMREIAEPAMGADPLKVAVLTALRLLDDLRASRAGLASSDAAMQERIEACAERLGRALGPSSSGGASPGNALDGALPLG
jgi:cell division protein ZapA